MFPPDHELSLRMEGVQKPRKRRGRRAKPSHEEKSNLVEQKKGEEEDDEELDAEGRRKRKIKVPARFLEAVQVVAIAG